MTSPGAALEVSGLVKRYGRVAAVDGVDLRAERGAVTALLGPNGAGKTTTVECCEGLRTPDAGVVRVLGRDPRRADADLRSRVGVMLQDGGLPTSVRPVPLLRHLARLHEVPRSVDGLVERLGIDGFAGTPVRRLSGGQRQRLALAAALVGRPELVFLDEPGAGLDPQSRLAVHEVVTDLTEEGVAVVLTTHDMAEAERLAQHVVVVDHGRVVAAGSPAELTDEARHGTTIRFGGPPALDLAGLARALPDGVHVTESARGAYLVAGRVDPQVVATVAAWCASHGVMPQQLTVGRRTLEDVFLDLTGRRLR
ncbi:MAG: ABC transporter ATP-binding protein [Actinomycetes bacterium]